jgi:hypothetical protein
LTFALERCIKVEKAENLWAAKPMSVQHKCLCNTSACATQVLVQHKCLCNTNACATQMLVKHKNQSGTGSKYKVMIETSDKK